MEPLFLAVVCGCNAGLFREALHEVYLPRIQRGDASFVANVLGARGALLSVLAHFFEYGRWGSPVKMAVEGQSLTPEDQLFILMQAALYLSATRESAPEIRICYERAESLCDSLNRPMLLYVILMGQWRYTLMTDKLTATMQIAKRIYSLAQEQNEPARLIGAYTVMAENRTRFPSTELATSPDGNSVLFHDGTPRRGVILHQRGKRLHVAVHGASGALLYGAIGLEQPDAQFDEMVCCRGSRQFHERPQRLGFHYDPGQCDHRADQRARRQSNADLNRPRLDQRHRRRHARVDEDADG